MSDLPPPPPPPNIPPNDAGSLPPPPPPPGGWDNADVVEDVPGLGSRFAARLIDALIIGIPVGIIFVDDFSQQSIGQSVLLTLVGIAYQVLMEGSGKGQTLGKMLVKIQVVREDGSAPSMEQALRRNAWLFLGLIPSGLVSLLSIGVVIWIAMGISKNPGGRGPHDTFAGAHVIRA